MRYLKNFNQLNESEAGDEVRRLIALPYEKFIKELKNAAANPRVIGILAKGKLDGKEHDEIIGVAEVDVSVKDLVPTQSELSLDDSLEKLPTFAKDIQRGRVVSVNNPIIIANGKYIIDGHHRWTTAYMVDPDAEIRAYDLQIPGMKPIDILKIVQLALAVEFGVIKSKKVEPGQEVFEISAKDARRWVVKNGSGYGIDVETIVNNIMSLADKRLAGAPDRRFMPQPKSSAKASGADKSTAVARLIKRLESGTINFKDPLETKDI